MPNPVKVISIPGCHNRAIMHVLDTLTETNESPQFDRTSGVGGSGFGLSGARDWRKVNTSGGEARFEYTFIDNFTAKSPSTYETPNYFLVFLPLQSKKEKVRYVYIDSQTVKGISWETYIQDLRKYNPRTDIVFVPYIFEKDENYDVHNPDELIQLEEELTKKPGVKFLEIVDFSNPEQVSKTKAFLVEKALGLPQSKFLEACQKVERGLTQYESSNRGFRRLFGDIAESRKQSLQEIKEHIRSLKNNSNMTQEAKLKSLKETIQTQSNISKENHKSEKTFTYSKSRLAKVLDNLVEDLEEKPTQRPE